MQLGRTLSLIISRAPRFPTMLAKLESSVHGTYLESGMERGKRERRRRGREGGREVYIVVEIEMVEPPDLLPAGD